MLPAPKPLELEGELSADAEPGHVTRGVEEHVGHVGLKGELRPLREHELDIWEELDRLLPEDELLYRKGSFGKTWHLRIQDYPSAVRAAVGEVRRMHVQGRIRKTLGGALNDQFKRFKLELYKGG